MSYLAKFAETVTTGKNREAVQLAAGLLAEGVSAERIIAEGLTKALEALDVKCTAAEFNLVEILLAGRAMTDVLDKVLRPHFVLQEGKTMPDPPVIVLGTIKGDIHDLGKRVVGTVLEAAGFKVIDLGKDVPPGEFALAAKYEQASFVGISSLLTVTIPEIIKVKDILRENGLGEVGVIAGGAAISRVQPELLNVDFVAPDAMAAWRYLTEHVRGGKMDAGPGTTACQVAKR